MRRTLSVIVLLVLVASLATACGGTTPEPTEPPSASTEGPSSNLSGELSIAGSTSVQPLAETLAGAFMERHPDVTIDVQGGGSSVGVTSAGEGTADIGNASRPVKDSEFEEFSDIQPNVIAWDGVAIVVHPDLPIANLSVAQVAQIFAGEITNYSEVGGPDADIVVVSREEGSGTRDAFQDKVMDAGEEELLVTADAILQNSNGALRTTVAETPNAIGYLSFGFLDESVKGVAIEGYAPTVENVLAEAYPVFRPFNMITNGEPEGLEQAFLDFVLSEEGQEIVAEDYIRAVGAGEAQATLALSGDLDLAGSTSVLPLAQLLADAFMERYPDVVIDVQGGGSSVGVTSAGEGTVDIGNASRSIKDSEYEEFPDLVPYTIAWDGIAIVVNPDVELEDLTVEQVAQIFAGEITNYSEVGGPDAQIIVVSREEGSGTRDAFQDKVMEAGEEERVITADAILQNSNGAVRTTVAETPDAMGYLSLGYVDDSVKALVIAGVEPSAENVLNDTYSLYRPLNMIANGAPSELAQAFLSFILSDEGQQIVAEDYIPIR